MMDSKNNLHRHSVTSVPVLLLVVVFAVMSLLVMLLSVNAYTGIQADLNADNDIRIGEGYLRNRLLAGELAFGVDIQQGPEGGSMLVSRTRDGMYDMIYVADGALRELYWDSSDGEFVPESGERIVNAGGLQACWEGRLLVLTLSDTEGRCATIRCARMSEEVAQ